MFTHKTNKQAKKQKRHIFKGYAIALCNCILGFAYAMAQPAPQDLTGCWMLKWEQTTHPMETGISYKFTGRHHSLMVHKLGEDPERRIYFEGYLSQLQMPTESTAIEQGLECDIERHGSDSLFFEQHKISYKHSDTIITSGKSLWVRSTPTMEMRNFMQAYDESHKRNDKFKGVWKLSQESIRGKTVPAKQLRFKIFGDDRYLTVTIKPRKDMNGNPYYEFTGHCGTVEYITEQLYREDGLERTVNWTDGNSFSSELTNIGAATYLDMPQNETWYREELPGKLVKMLSGTGLPL